MAKPPSQTAIGQGKVNLDALSAEAAKLADGVTRPGRNMGDPIVPLPSKSATSRTVEPCGKLSISLPLDMIDKLNLAVFNNKRSKQGHVTISAIIRDVLRDAGW